MSIEQGIEGVRKVNVPCSVCHLSVAILAQLARATDS